LRAKLKAGRAEKKGKGDRWSGVGKKRCEFISFYGRGDVIKSSQLLSFITDCKGNEGRGWVR
jgi:hypothetical protein